MIKEERRRKKRRKIGLYILLILILLIAAGVFIVMNVFTVENVVVDTPHYKSGAGNVAVIT